VRQESEKKTKWQQHWNATTKRLVTKEYFPNIKERIKMKISLSPNFTAYVTAHGQTKAFCIASRYFSPRNVAAPTAARQRITSYLTATGSKRKEEN